MEHASRGAVALESNDALSAVKSYTHALIQHPTSPDYFTQRSTAFARLTPARHDLALQDAEYAILCGQKRAKRDKIQAAQQRRVVALYGLGRYADAAKVLEMMIRWRPADNKKDKMEGDIWKAKIQGKLKNLPEEQRQKQPSVSEYPDFELPAETKILAALKKQLNADGTYNFDWQAVSSALETSDTNGVSNTASEQAPSTASAITTAQPAPPAKIRHEWYQNHNSVIVTLYAKGVPKDKAEFDIQHDHVSQTPIHESPH